MAINKNQLRMLMTAKELMAEANPTDRVYNNKYGLDTDERVWARKTDEADMNGLTSSIRRHGVRMPVQLGHEGDKVNIEAGHHRIAAQAAVNPDAYIPVVHAEGGREQALKDARRLWGSN